MIVWIGLGANLGPARLTLAKACAELDAGPLRLLAVSALYASRPMGPADQPDFFNAVARVASGLGLGQMLAELKGIESRLGRQPRARWRERELDLDLLLAVEDGPCGCQLRTPALQVPHPGLWERVFVLAPLLEVSQGLDTSVQAALVGKRDELMASQPDALRRVEEAGWFRSS